MITFADFGEFMPDLLRAAVVTVQLTVIAFALAMVGGLILALARISTHRLFRFPAKILVAFLRGTPLIFQLFCVY